MGKKEKDSLVIMSHPPSSVLRLFICILISVVMLIMRRYFLSHGVFVFPKLEQLDDYQEGNDKK